MEALLVGGAFSLVLSAVIYVFIFLLETVPFLAISILIGLIIGFFISFNNLTKRHIKERERRGELNVNSFLMYLLTTLTTLFLIYTIVGFIGSSIHPNNIDLDLKQGNLYILEELSKKIF